MTAKTSVEATVSSSQTDAIASANGSGTVARYIQVSRPGPDASVSTLLAAGRVPPSWVERVVTEEVPAKDELSLIRTETLVRFARTCLALPSRTPKPYVGVGDDATIGAEWDLGRYHVEFQVGNNADVDSIIVEIGGGEPDEIPLDGNVGVLIAVMSYLARIVED